MDKEFVPYELALALKGLGYDEHCYGYYEINYPQYLRHKSGGWGITGDAIKITHLNDDNIRCPLYQQAFRWFREKHKLHSVVITNLCSPVKNMWFMYQIGKEGEGDYFKKVANFTSHKEAELECLKKLIEIAKENNNV